jgi:hypothetical protein
VFTKFEVTALQTPDDSFALVEVDYEGKTIVDVTQGSFGLVCRVLEPLLPVGLVTSALKAGVELYMERYWTD